MIVIALETATSHAGVALHGPGGLVASWRLAAGRRHGETVAPAVAGLLAEAGLSAGEIGAVVADVGPGLFTGLRVGIATAQGLAAAVGVPAVGVMSLDVLAFPHRRLSRPVVAVVDARRGEVFRAVHAGGERLVAPAVLTPEALADELASMQDRPLVVGDGALRYAALLEVHAEVGVSAEAFPDPAVLAALGAAVAASGGGGPPHQLRPVYLRQADVRIGWATRTPAPEHA